MRAGRAITRGVIRFVYKSRSRSIFWGPQGDVIYGFWYGLEHDFPRFSARRQCINAGQLEREVGFLDGMVLCQVHWVAAEPDLAFLQNIGAIGE